MSNEYDDPPDPAPALTVRDVGIVRHTLDQIRAAGISGSEMELITQQQDNEENEAGDDATPDVCDTPYLRELEKRAAARARHARRWRPKLIAALRMAPFPTVACRFCCVDWNTVRLHRQRDAVFDEACRLAEEHGAALLMASAWASAVDGNMEPVYHAGVLVGHVRKYSDRMRVMFLKGLYPSMFDRAERVNLAVKAAGAGGDPGEDTIDAVKAHEIVTKLSPVMAARHMAMIQGQKPPELPGQGGFVRLDQVPATKPKPQ